MPRVAKSKETKEEVPKSGTDSIAGRTRSRGGQPATPAPAATKTVQPKVRKTATKKNKSEAPVSATEPEPEPEPIVEAKTKPTARTNRTKKDAEEKPTEPPPPPVEPKAAPKGRTTKTKKNANVEKPVEQLPEEPKEEEPSVEPPVVVEPKARTTKTKKNANIEKPVEPIPEKPKDEPSAEPPVVVDPKAPTRSGRAKKNVEVEKPARNARQATKKDKPPVEVAPAEPKAVPTRTNNRNKKSKEEKPPTPIADEPAIPDEPDAEVPMTIDEDLAVVEKPSEPAAQVSENKINNEKMKSTAQKRPISDADESPLEAPIAKRQKKVLLSVVGLPQISGKVMSCGDDSSGELGFKMVGLTKRRPADVGINEKFAMVVAGSMHSFAVSTDGKKVYSFGCNDESALGRSTAVNGDFSSTDISINDTTEEITTEMLESTPMVVTIPSTSVVKISAGDSHTAALTEIGALYCWGCFRDQNGKIGIDVNTAPAHTHVPFMPMPYEVTISDMSSGDNHILLLTNEGKVYTFGQAEQGQLGRVPQQKAKFKLEEKELYLTPKQVLIDGRDDVKCDRVWATTFRSFVRTLDGRIFAWGLNNYSQLGLQTRVDSNGAQILIEYAPLDISDQFPKDVTIESIVGGTHHSLALDNNGQVYAWGRHHYGRLGLGDVTEEHKAPTLIETLKDEKVVELSCGGDSSFAVTADGKLFSWGMGSVHLGHSMPDDEMNTDILIPKRILSKKLTETKAKFLSASSGSSHLITIVTTDSDTNNGPLQ